MSRPLRITFAGAFYHVMNRGTDRCPIFLDPDGDRALFKYVLGQSVEKWKIRIHAFSLMSNHYHLLVETPLPNLSRALRHLDGVYTQKFNKKYNRDGPLFRGRFKSKLVHEEKYFLELIRYIHLNGVRAQIVSTPDMDRNSSHPFYLRPSLAPPWLTTSVVLSHFHPHSEQARQEFDRFVRAGVSNEIVELLENKRWPAIFGSKDFIDKIRNRYLKNNPEPEKPQERALQKTGLQTPDQIFTHLSHEFNVSLSQITSQSSAKFNEVRKIAMALLYQECQLSQNKIGDLMGGVTNSAVAHAIQWVRKNCPDRLNGTAKKYSARNS